jgi:hypothetical protein
MFLTGHSMATGIDFIPSATTANAEEESHQVTWTEIAVTVIFIGITVLIVGTISVLMAMA